MASVDSWIAPLASDTGPCGPDLHYDNDYLALTQAAAGRPKTTFDAEVPPDWRAVRAQAEALLARSRDLRIALLWLRAMLNTEGFVALPGGLRLLHGLLHAHWDALHPLPDPDDGDPYARLNALAELRDASRLLGDVRRSVLFSARGFGDIRVRAVEVAFGHLQARDDDPPLSKEQLTQLLAAAVGQDAALQQRPAEALQQLAQLGALLDARAPAADVPDFKPLRALLQMLAAAMPAATVAQTAAVAPVTDTAASLGGATAPIAQVAAVAPTAGLSGQVRSREDAIRAIDMVCEFLERTEPSSPAPLLLRRARRMIDHNFLQLMKELAPDALAEVARLMGVDPESVQLNPP
jgi:type VI secretion system protein ImpA